MKIRTKEDFPYKVGDFAPYPMMSTKITAVATCHINPDMSVIMGETPDDGYVVAMWDKSEKVVKDTMYYETDEDAVFDYIERTFGVSV